MINIHGCAWLSVMLVSGYVMECSVISLGHPDRSQYFVDSVTKTETPWDVDMEAGNGGKETRLRQPTLRFFTGEI